MRSIRKTEPFGSKQLRVGKSNFELCITAVRTTASCRRSPITTAKKESREPRHRAQTRKFRQRSFRFSLIYNRMQKWRVRSCGSRRSSADSDLFLLIVTYFQQHAMWNSLTIRR